MKAYRLPNGEVLHGKKNEQSYVDAWRKFTEPIEKATGVKAYGFDPGVLFRSEELQTVLDLPYWFIERINNALTKGETYIEQPKKKPDYLDEWERLDEYWIKKKDIDTENSPGKEEG